MSSTEETTNTQQYKRKPTKLWWDDIVEDIESANFESFKKHCHGLHDFNYPIPPYIPLHPVQFKSSYKSSIIFHDPTLSHYIIINELPDFLQYLLHDEDGVVDPLCYDGANEYNAFHYACMTKDTSYLKLLLTCRAVQANLNICICPSEPNARTNVLHLAAIRGFIETILILFSPLPKVEYESKEDTQLQIHIKEPEPKPEPVKKLPHYDDYEEEEEEEEETVEEHEEEEEEIPVEHININGLSTNGLTALHFVTILKDFQTAYLLCCLGADPKLGRTKPEGNDSSSVEDGQSPYDIVNNWEKYSRKKVDGNWVRKGEIRKRRFTRLFAAACQEESPFELKTLEQCILLYKNGERNLFKAKPPADSFQIPDLGTVSLPSLDDPTDISSPPPAPGVSTATTNKADPELIKTLNSLNKQIETMSLRLAQLEKQKVQSNPSPSPQNHDITGFTCTLCGVPTSEQCPTCQKPYCQKCIKKIAHLNNCQG